MFVPPTIFNLAENFHHNLLIGDLHSFHTKFQFSTVLNLFISDIVFSKEISQLYECLVYPNTFVKSVQQYTRLGNQFIPCLTVSVQHTSTLKLSVITLRWFGDWRKCPRPICYKLLSPPFFFYSLDYPISLTPSQNWCQEFNLDEPHDLYCF